MSGFVVGLQWSVGRRNSSLRVTIPRGFRLLGSDRVEVGVQHWTQRLGQTGQFGDFIWRQELPAKCPTEEMLRLVEGAPRSANETPIVGERSTPLSLGDVGAHRIRGSNQLFPDGFLGETVPSGGDFPDAVRKFFRETIDSKLFEVRFAPNTHVRGFAKKDLGGDSPKIATRIQGAAQT